MPIKSSRPPIPPDKMPEHIGIIMDGNGRWAKMRGLPRSAGHKRGAEVFTKTVEYCQELGIRYLTVFAFSTENWRRPPDEVEGIMSLLRDYLRDARRNRDKNIRTVFLGDKLALDEEIRGLMLEAERQTRDCTGITACIAINYGGRDELVRAARLLAEEVKAGGLEPSAIDERMVSERLYTRGIPDPDLIVRPSGEKRLSNFLIWQAAYAEFVWMDVLWPDFSRVHLYDALRQYAQRDRRFGASDSSIQGRRP